MKNWTKAVVKPDATLFSVLEAIDSSAAQIALVADQSQRLIGTVTDGDIRRGLLKGLKLESPVSQVMHTSAVTIMTGTPRAERLSLMTAHSVKSLPIVDRNGYLVGLETIDEVLSEKDYPNAVVIMAGGLGTRLKPLTDNCPKPLLEVGGKPILENIILNFIEHGFRKFHIAVNYKADMVTEYFGDGRNWNVEIDYLHEQQPLGTAGALSLLPSIPKDPVIVMNGDLLTKTNFARIVDFHNQQEADGTVCVREHEVEVPFGVIELRGERITRIQEKPRYKHFVSTGMYVLNPEVFPLIPRNMHLDMPSFLNRLAADNFDIKPFALHEQWLDIGNHNDFAQAQKLASTDVSVFPIQPSVTFIS